MPEKEKAKSKKPKTEKTDEQLRAEYLKRVEKAVQSIDRQYLKLKRAFKSKKAAMTDEQKAKVLSHISETEQAFQKAISSSVEEDTSFSL